ncbi:hypothetical protein F4604DRAFT_1763184 [Suillus subluteus]|nr:hypothetical protein F4604DRAFT_1763184 [Suillus subluteus]
MSTTLADPASLDLMFPQELISLEMRPLSSSDYKRGHLDVLSAAWVSQFHAMRATPSAYFSVVILDKASDKIVGVGTVFIERKFLRGLGSVGHIEDIAVDKSQQGKKLALTHISESSGCYKTILNCNDTNIPFYQKCGYVKKENEMAKYAPERDNHAPNFDLPSHPTLVYTIINRTYSRFYCGHSVHIPCTYYFTSRYS